MLQGIQSYDCLWGEIFNVSFDKFLKINDGETKETTSNISNSYKNRLKKKMKIFSNFVE